MQLLTTAEKDNRIAGILQEITESYRQGQPVQLQTLNTQYPELMPDLAIRLAAIQAQEDPHPWASEEDAKLKFIREALVDMDALECLDRGAQGAVYKAIHLPTKREVAIKILLGGPLASQEQRHRFAREVQLVARLRHPNIVRVYDSGEIGGCCYIVMEFIQGLRIDDYACVEQLSVPDIISLFCRVCDAVSAAHQYGVLHRDLKPSNILVDLEGEPRVLDFGLAKDMGANRELSLLSMSGQIVGTMPYLSPEQVKRNESNTSCDLYALGVILFELLTGTYPYPITDDSFETLSNIVHQDPASPRKVLSASAGGPFKSSDINSDLEKIVLKALAKDPARRYATVAEFAADLRRYLSGEAVLARSESRIYVLRKTMRKFRIFFAAAAVCTAILIAALVMVTREWRRSEQVAKVAMAGLEMSSLLKLGSVERDAGRIDQAITLFEKVLEVGNSAPARDPLVLRQFCNAHHRLAGLQLDKKNVDRAALHAKKSFDAASELVRSEPGNLEYQSQLALARAMRGQVAFNRANYERAIGDFKEASSIQRSLLAAKPHDPSLVGDLAFTLEWQAHGARKLGLSDLATESYLEVYEIHRALSQADPANLGRRIDLADAESKLAVHYISLKSKEGDDHARRWLESAESHLSQIKQRDDAGLRQDSIDKLTYEIAYNKGLLERLLTSPAQP